MVYQPGQKRASQKEKDKQRERSIGRKEKVETRQKWGSQHGRKEGRRDGGEKGI